MEAGMQKNSCNRHGTKAWLIVAFAVSGMVYILMCADCLGTWRSLVVFFLFHKFSFLSTFILIRFISLHGP